MASPFLHGYHLLDASLADTYLENFLRSSVDCLQDTPLASREATGSAIDWESHSLPGFPLQALSMADKAPKKIEHGVQVLDKDQVDAWPSRTQSSSACDSTPRAAVVCSTVPQLPLLQPLSTACWAIHKGSEPPALREPALAQGQYSTYHRHSEIQRTASASSSILSTAISTEEFQCEGAIQDAEVSLSSGYPTPTSDTPQISNLRANGRSPPRVSPLGFVEVAFSGRGEIEYRLSRGVNRSEYLKYTGLEPDLYLTTEVDLSCSEILIQD